MQTPVTNWRSALMGVVLAWLNHDFNWITLHVGLDWEGMISKGATALVVGLMGATGGFVGKKLLRWSYEHAARWVHWIEEKCHQFFKK